MVLKSFIGLDLVELYTNYYQVKNILFNEGIRYDYELWDNSDCDVPYNWNILCLENGLRLFFSEGNYKLFKIYAESNSACEMYNEIDIGTFIEKAELIDPTLKYNEMEEIYESENGYWLETDLDDKVASLSVFVKEINDENFDECKW